MKKDITDRNDIEALVNLFYTKVKNDDILKHFFKKVSWEKHLNVMYNFWENAIFYTGSYVGNPMNVHQHLHQKMPLSELDFERWIYLFMESTDELFTGEKAKLIKHRAISIATVMKLKIIEENTVQ